MGIVNGVLALLNKVLSFFHPKTEAERAVDKDKREVRDRKKKALARAKAVAKAKRGDTRDAEKYLN